MADTDRRIHNITFYLVTYGTQHCMRNAKATVLWNWNLYSNFLKPTHCHSWKVVLITRCWDNSVCIKRIYTYDAYGLPYFISSSGVMQFREVCYTVVSYAPYILLQIYTLTNLATFQVTIFDFFSPWTPAYMFIVTHIAQTHIKIVLPSYDYCYKLILLSFCNYCLMSLSTKSDSSAVFI